MKWIVALVLLLCMTAEADNTLIDAKQNFIKGKEQYNQGHYTKAKRLYKRACYAGLDDVCNSLAFMYIDGVVSSDYADMVEVLEMGCSKNNALSCLLLASTYQGAYTIQYDASKAVQAKSKGCTLLEKDAELWEADIKKQEWNCDGKKDNKFKTCNNGVECFNLAYNYHKGSGVEQDDTKAVYFYTKACKLGKAGACFNIGLMYNKGKGITQNHLKSSEFYIKACDLGHARGCTQIGNFYKYGTGVRKNISDAKKYFDKSCELGDSDGCLLAKNISSDINEVSQDYKNTCDTGLGCNNIAVNYYYGQGVKQNYFKALAFFTKACTLGDADGCYKVAYTYEHGEGVEQNYFKAVEFYKKSCALDDGAGCYTLGFMYKMGYGVEEDDNEAVQFYKKSCDLGTDAGCQSYERWKK